MLGRLVDAPLDLRLGHVAQLQPEREVVAHGHVRVQRVALEDHRDVAVLGRDVVDDAIADPQRAAGDVLEARRSSAGWSSCRSRTARRGP